MKYDSLENVRKKSKLERGRSKACKSNFAATHLKIH